MTKEIDRAGIPIVQVTSMTPIAEMVGTNRILRGESIVSPLGDYKLSPEREMLARKELVKKALSLLTGE